MSNRPTSFREIIELWPTRKAFGDAIGVKESAAKLMHFRNNIHVQHWQKLTAAARAAGFKSVTLDLLVSIAGQKKAAA